jgi:predicted nucleic acid-binding protein
VSRPVVVDASAALVLLLEQAGSSRVRDRISSWKAAGVALHVPTHFWLEVANSLLRRHRLPASVAVEALHRLDELGLETVEVSRPLLLVATDLAERHDLSAYDATYLALAQTLDAALLSGDARLLAAAGPRAVQIGVGGHKLSEMRASYSGTPTWAGYGEIGQYLASLRARTLESKPASR